MLEWLRSIDFQLARARLSTGPKEEASSKRTEIQLTSAFYPQLEALFEPVDSGGSAKLPRFFFIIIIATNCETNASK